MTKPSSLCLDCKNALGNCSWSEVDPETGKIRFQPVEGWTAEQVPYRRQDGTYETNYLVVSCPLFEIDARLTAEKPSIPEEKIDPVRILILSDAGYNAREISSKLGVSRPTIEFWLKKLSEEGL